MINSDAVFEALLDWIYPPRCAACSGILPIQQARAVVCEGCAAELPRVIPPFCSVCGSPIEDGDICLRCIRVNSGFVSNRSLFVYEGAVRKIIHSFKFDNRPQYGAVLGKWMAEYLDSFFEDVFTEKPQLIVPVPLHSAKYRSRGYNQSELLAEQIQNLKRIEMRTDILARVKDTTPQSGLGAKERSRNLSDAFSVTSPEAVQGKSILLVDDIYTTGSTMRGCAHSLKKAGAGNVFCFTLSVVPEKKFTNLSETVN